MRPTTLPYWPLLVAALALATALAPAPLAADGEYLVQDVGSARTVPLTEVERAEEHAVLDGVAYFHKDDGRHGYELWRSDGTAAGTYLLRDICPGVCGSDEFHRPWLASHGSRIYFAADDGVHGSELWSTDGTAEGTRMVADIVVGPVGSKPSEITAGEGRVYFLAGNDWPQRRIWVSDGTATGTAPLFDAEDDPLGPTGSWTLVWGNRLLFAKNSQMGPLWRSDGTAAGTFQIHPLAGLPSSWHFFQGHQFLPDGTLVFQGCESQYYEQNCEPWRSDGTVAGTFRLADLSPGMSSSSPSGFVRVGAEIWFGAWPPEAGSELRLYRTDGTISGTSMVPLPAGLEPRVRNISPAAPIPAGLVFIGCDETAGCEPWFADGSDAYRINDIVPGAGSSLEWNYPADRPRLTSVGDEVLFLATMPSGGVELWRTNGSALGTESVSGLDEPPTDALFGGFFSSAYPPMVAGGRWILPIFRSDRGTEIWSSDGTVSGTSRVATIAEEATAYLHSIDRMYSPTRLDCMAPLGSGIVTKMANVAAPADSWLFYSDGTPDAAAQLHPLDHEEYGRSAECAAIGTEVLAVTPSPTLVERFLRTRGTVETTETLPVGGGYSQSVPAFELSRSEALGGDYLAIVASEGELTLIPEAAELESIVTWPTGLRWGELVSAGERLFLADSYGRLEVTDGSEAPTTLLEPPPAPELQHDLSDAVAAGERLFFVLETVDEGAELWTSDGSIEGTGPVRNLRPGAPGGFDERPTQWIFHRPWEPRLVALDGERIVFQASDGTTGFELWASDGTEAGTMVVADIAPGPDGSWPRHLVALGNGTVLFAAEHPKLGYELFRTDGTAAGTSMVRDLVVGPGSSVPDDFVVQDGVLYFSAWTPTHGREAWRSDGSFAGTRRLTDVAPGPLSSSPSRFVRRGNRLFFTATDHVHGFELWARADDGSIPLFIDGFEIGDAGRWSAEIP
jgi:ELWxxDGT repeat protein